MSEEMLDTKSIIERLNEVEKRYRNIRLTAAAALIVALVAMVLHVPGELGFRKGKGLSTDDQVLEAKKIIVRDSVGRQRIVMSARGQNTSSLVFTDGNGKERLTLTFDAEHSGLVLRDADEKTTRAIALGLLKGMSLLAFIDGNGKERLTLASDAERSRLVLRDAEEKTTRGITLALDKEGAVLSIPGENENGLIAAVGEDGPSLQLNDREGKLRAVFGVTRLETTKTGEQRITPPSSIILFGKDETVLWKAP